MSEPTGRERFGRWAPTYDRSASQRLCFDPVHALVLRALEAAPRRPERLLDVGCGTGRLLRAATMRLPGIEAVGVDPSPAMIEVARGKGLPVRFQVGFAESLAFPDGSFDAAVSTLSMHHWTDPAGGLHEVGRVVRPGGVLVLADIHLGGVYAGIRRLLPAAQHDHAFTRADLGALLHGAGLAVRWQRAPLRYGRSLLITVAERT